MCLWGYLALSLAVLSTPCALGYLQQTINKIVKCSFRQHLLKNEQVLVSPRHD